MVDLLHQLSNPPKPFRRATGSDPAPDTDEPLIDAGRPFYAARPQLTPEQRSQVVERYQAGERAHQLAQSLGIHRETVANVLIEAGVRRPRLMTTDERAEAIELYNQGWTCQAIGDHLGRSRDAVRRALHAAGVQLRDPRRDYPTGQSRPAAGRP